MWTDQALAKLSDETLYPRSSLFQALKGEKKDLSEITFRWTLYNLLSEQKIYKAGYDSYSIRKPAEKTVYTPCYSEEALKLMNDIEERYPNLTFVVFESVLLNEFLNHLIAQNTIHLQVEKDISSFIFDNLRDSYDTVLYKPGIKVFDRYWKRNCIVILDLISQAPLSKENEHIITIEKLLVDLIADKTIAATFSPSELPSIYETAVKNYSIERQKMYRYAERRGKKSEVEKYLSKEVSAISGSSSGQTS